MGHRNLEILKRNYFQRAQEFGMVWYGLVWFCWYSLVCGGVQMTSEFIYEEISIMDYNGLS